MTCTLVPASWSRIDSLSDNLHDRAETLRNPEAAVDKAGETVGRAGETAGRAGETVGRATGLRRRRREADVEDEAEPDLDGEERGNGRVERKRSRASEEPADEYDEPADDYEEEDVDEGPADDAGELEEEEAEEPAPRRRRTTRSPVVRARR